MSHIAEVRRILSSDEHEAAWTELATYLTPLKAPKANLTLLLDELIPYCLAHFQGWPKELRRHPLPEWFLNAKGSRRPSKQWNPCFLLCNAVAWNGLMLQNKDIPKLLDSPYLENIQYFSLRENQVSRSGFQAIFETENLPNLVELDLSYNFFSKGVLKDIQKMVESSHFSHFQKMIFTDPHHLGRDREEEKELKRLAKLGKWEIVLE